MHFSPEAHKGPLLQIRCFLLFVFFIIIIIIVNNTHHPEFHQIRKQEFDPMRDLALFDDAVYEAKVLVYLWLKGQPGT